MAAKRRAPAQKGKKEEYSLVKSKPGKHARESTQKEEEKGNKRRGWENEKM